MNKSLEMLLEVLDRCESLGARERFDAEQRMGWLASADYETIDVLLKELVGRDAPPPDSSTDHLLGVVFQSLSQRLRALPRGSDSSEFPASMLGHITLLYQHLGSASGSRHHLLSMLSLGHNREASEQMAELMATDPPRDETAVALALAPLFQRKDSDATALFPRLLDGLSQPHAAAAILDLANFVTREEITDQHPASHRTEQLRALLSGLSKQLAQLEESPAGSSNDVRDASDTVSQSVALAVSLCDALALIGDRSAVGALNQALELGHRRLRTEAAAALARLGEAHGQEALLAMAAQPVARLRTLAYAEELNLLDRVDDQFKTLVARAEAELALWLAEPTQFGIPPTQIELVDQRAQYWPSFDEPVECFLFRFAYNVGQRQYSNIGIAGPLAHAFAADLADLPPDDIYAAFAGWQAVHDEMYELDIDRLNERAETDVARFVRRLGDSGYESVQPLKFCVFFGEKVLIAAASRLAASGLAVVDSIDIFWYPQGERNRPLGAEEVYCIYKGRKLLRQFNE